MENDNHENDNHENKNDNEKTTSQSSDEFSTESDDIPSHTGRSDEVCEAQRVAERESVRVRLQRFITTDIMIMVTCALVLTTYGLLRDAEKQNFEKSYAQLSQTLSQAAIKQHRGNQDALESLAESLSTGLSAAESSELDSSVSSSNSSVWPFFEPKDFAREAHQVLKLSSIQTLTFAPLVAQEHKEQWLNYANRLVADSAGLNQASEADYEQFITQYHPYMTRYDPDTEEYVKDADSRDYYFPSLAVAPAPLELYRVLNYNLASYPQATDNFEALRTFQTETLLSPSRTALTQMLSPILQNSETTQQEQNTLVGVVQGEFSWGNLLAGVLPEGSKTIVAVIRSNNCNSTYTYEVTGQNVNAVASADLHDAYYDEYQRTVDLSPASFVNPNASNTHGRCQYQMVRALSL